LTAADARRVTEIVRFWPPSERAWWRELLDSAPDEALKIVPLILLDAYPVEGRVADTVFPASPTRSS
jgi:hypothetical protein